ncbi:MAG: cytochrome c biogenesis protein CcsA [Bacteroidaceae bacterium]|nr:cytochrome c biogenesis protein CcsA [Bacteroidaceae bacterium]
MRNSVLSKLPFIGIGVAVVVIAAATFVEARYGTSVAHEWFYGSVAFKLLWFVIAVSGAALLWKKRMWKRLPLGMLHLSFVVILLGALLTSLTGKQGMLHLRQGIPSDCILSDRNAEQLPFLVRLDTFYVSYYPGTEAPQDYVSVLFIKGESYTVSMNRIACVAGYRFYQSSYDPDENGTVLSVNYDPWGIPVTYSGYGMLVLSMVGYFLRDRRRKSVLLLLAFFSVLPLSARTSLSQERENASLPVISKTEARRIARQQVMWNNRPCPVGVMAQDVLLKVYGGRSYRGLSPTQVIASWTLAPERWNREPIIRIKRGEYACMDDYIDRNQRIPRLKNIGKDVRIDEKVALLLMLQQGTLVRELPPDVVALSDTKVSIELFYARVPWVLWGMLFCFALALASCFVRVGWGRWSLFLFLSVSFALRWYIAGHVPLSNGYETMFFLALCLLAVSGSSLSLLMAAFVLLVAHLAEQTPQVTPLLPVLHSPWLTAHVSVIMISYALLALSIVNRKWLSLAVCLLAVGIFLGAVWANVSWGTYWSWDPKESWALITLLIFSLPLHEESLPWFRSARNYRIYGILGLLSLLMTYWGVNYLLGGMHSYG